MPQHDHVIYRHPFTVLQANSTHVYTKGHAPVSTGTRCMMACREAGINKVQFSYTCVNK